MDRLDVMGSSFIVFAFVFVGGLVLGTCTLIGKCFFSYELSLPAYYFWSGGEK